MIHLTVKPSQNQKITQYKYLDKSFPVFYGTAQGGFATRRTLSPGCKPGESDAGKLMTKYLDSLKCVGIKFAYNKDKSETK